MVLVINVHIWNFVQKITIVAIQAFYRLYVIFNYDFFKNTTFTHFPKIHLIQILFSWSFAEPLERADGAPVTLGSTRWEPLYYSNWNYNNYSTFRFLNTWWQRLFISCHILTLYLLANISEIFQNCLKLNE